MKSRPRRIRQSFWRMLLCVIAFLMAWISPSDLFAAGGDLDTTFNPGTGAGSAVKAIALQPDGKILIAGFFTSYNSVGRNRIARLNADGSLDTTFDPGTGASHPIHAIALQPDGKILIGGEFTSYNNTTRNRIARLESNGSLDTSFNDQAINGSVNALAVQPDGHILIGGSFTSVSTINVNRIARLIGVNGTLDQFFNQGGSSGANDTVHAIVVRPNGQIVIGGAFTSYNGAERNRVARLDANGTRQADTGTGADGSVFSIALYTDGRVIIAGAFTTYNTTISRNRIARITPSGLVDTSFNPGTGADGSIFATALQPDGKIVVGGFLTSYNGVARRGLARVNADGSLDNSFDPGAGLTGGTSSVNAIAVQPDGRIIIGGDFTSYNGIARRNIARLLPAPGALSFTGSTNGVNEGAGTAAITVTRTGGTDNTVTAKVTITDGTAGPADYINAPGQLDLAFDPGNGADGPVYALAVQSDGKLIIGGDFTSYDGVARNRIARVNANGSLDTTFDPGAGADGFVGAVALQTDGKILIAGAFTSYDGVTRNRIARLNTDGSRDISFDPETGADLHVMEIAIQSDGRIIIVGAFSTYKGAPRKGIARLHADASLDLTFDPGTGPDDGAAVVVLQPDGKIIIGGYFSSYNGVARGGIARLNANGSLDTTFITGTGANNEVSAIALQPDDKIIIGGYFDTYDGVARSGIARLNAIGTLDSTFNPGTATNGDAVFEIALQPDGKLVIGGDFTSFDGVPRERLARLNVNGSLDTTFNPGTGAPSGFVLAVALQPDGKIIIGGNFTSYNGFARTRIARVEGDLFATWAAGDAGDKAIRLGIVDDALAEGNETLTLTLTNLTGGATTGANATQTLTIIDNDVAPTPGLVANVSTRLPVGTDDNVLIEGFIVQGPTGSTKKIMVRAIGPSLIPFGIPDAVENPTLEIRDAGNALIASNNDWRTTQVGGIITGDQAAEIEGSGLAPSNDFESAIIADLAPGSYTAVVRGVNNTVGTGVVDAYDLSPASPAKLANIATRGLIQPGDKLMIAGFIIQNADVRLVVRAIGPSLSAFGISNALSDTTLELRDQNGTLVRANDDWESDQKQVLENSGLQPSDPKEAAVLATVSPGQYTVQVRGKPEATGIGVVQVYFLE